MAGTILGFMKFVLGFDSVGFKKGMTETEKELVRFQKRLGKIGKDMAVVGAAMSAAITLPLTKFAADGIREARETEEALSKVNNALAQTGAVAGQTAPELEKAAAAFETKSLYEADQVLSDVTARLLSFGKIAPANFQAAQQAAIDFAQKSGKGLSDASVAIGKALSSPQKGLKALQAVGVTFTKEQTKQLQTWVDTGNAAKAQGVILDALNSKIKGAALAAQEVDPWNKLSDAYKGLAETVGTTLLPYVVQFVSGLAGLLNGLNSLAPGLSAVAVGFLAILAAVGPVTTLLGGFMTIVSGSKEVAAFAQNLVGMGDGAKKAALGTAALNISLGPLLIALAALAVAVTAVVVAWNNWDKIVEFVSGVYHAVETWIVDAVGSAFEWLEGILDSVVGWFQGLLRAVPALRALYVAVKTWVQDKIATVWNWLKGAIETVSGWFGGMVERVRSFLAPIANVIGGSFKNAFAAVGAQFSGFKAPPISPGAVSTFSDSVAEAIGGGAEKGAKKAKARVQKAVDELAPVLDRLFPEEAASRKFTKEVELLNKALESGRISAEKYADAAHRLLSEFGGDPLKNLKIEMKDGFDPDEPLLPEDEYKTTMDQLTKLTKDKTVEMAEAWGAMATDAVYAMRGMVDAFKSGDILGGIQMILETVLHVLQSLRQMGMIGGGTGAGVQGASLGTFAGALAKGGPVVPGKTYLVGEKGPEFLTTNRRGFVHPNGKDAEPQRVVVVPSPYFDVVVDRRAANVAAPMAGQAAVAGVAGSEARSARRTRRNLLAA